MLIREDAVEGLLILLALAAVVWFLAGPLLMIAVLQRVRALEEAVESLRRARARDAAQQAREPARLPPRASHEAQPAATPESVQPEQPVQSQPIDVLEVLRRSHTERAAGTPAQPPAAKPTPRSRAPESPFWEDLPANLEEALAGKWMAWVGAIALVVGAGFFFKYAIEQGWVGPQVRVLMGVTTGCLCFAGGVYAMLRNYRFVAEGLVGAALGILYFSLFAAAKWYEPPVLGLTTSFIGMSAATAAALAFAAYFNAQPAAVLGLIGGLLTPVMLSRGVDNRWVLFSYLLMLDLGVLGVASFRHWPRLNLLALAGTVLMWLGWFARYYAPEKLTDAVILMSLFFVVFALLGVWHHLIRRSAAQPEDWIVVLATPILYFAGLYYMTERDYSHLQGLLAVTLAAIYAGLAVACLWRKAVDAKIPFAFGGLAVMFVTLAAPLQWTGHWITIAWAAESLILFEMGLRFHQPRLSTAGLVLLAGVACILAIYALTTFADAEDFSTQWVRRTPAEPLALTAGDAGPSWRDLLNGRSFSFLAGIVVMGVMAWESSRREPRGERLARTSPQETGDWLFVAAVAFGLTLLVVETFSLWYRLDAFVPTLLSLIAIEASLIGVGLLAAAAVAGPRWLDRLAVIAFAIAGGVLLISFVHTLIDWRSDWRTLTESGARDTLWRLLLINPRGIGFLIALTAAAAGGILWKRLQARQTRTSLPFDAGALLGLGCVVTGFIWLTAETYAWGVLREWRTTTSLAITLVWTLYSAAVLIAGIAMRSSGLRKLSLAMFVLTTGKVFLLDVWQLETAIRTFAFVALGVALLTVSWLYRRHRDRIRGWIEAEQ